MIIIYNNCLLGMKKNFNEFFGLMKKSYNKFLIDKSFNEFFGLMKKSYNKFRF